MAGEAPAYIAQENVGGAPGVNLEPVAIPQFQDTVGPAEQQLGEAGTEFADKLQHATIAANATNALSTYLTSLDTEKMARIKDPDWQNAPKAFGENVATLQNDALGKYNFDPRTAALLRLHMTHATIAAGDEVQKAALARGANDWESDYQNQAQYNQNAASTAGSPIARQTAIDRNDALIQTGVNAGWISSARAADLQRNFQTGLDHAQTLRLISSDPKAAIGILSNPDNMPTLTPVQRESYIEHAQEKVDADATERARGTVAGKPYVASLAAGQFVDSAHVGALFDNGVVPQESNGTNQPPNAKGAFGPAQITPAFARDYAGRLPADEQAALGDITKLSDKELTDKLMTLPKVSTDIGRLGFQVLAARYNGNPVLAMAAYNAGTKPADQWQAKAQEQFGPNPTPAQIMSVIDYPETQKYVASIYDKAHAPLDAFGVSAAGRFHMGTVLGTELQEQQTRDQHVVNQIASVQGASDPVPKLLDDGLDVGADRISAYRSAQLQAAQGGDVEAARRLHELDLAIAVKPQVDRLYRLPFPVMSGAVDAAEEQARQPGANITADQMHALDVMQKTRDAINTARMNDPTSLIVRAGLAKGVSVDTSLDANDPNFRNALVQRGGQALMAQKLYGGSALALTPQETQSLKERYNAGVPDEQFKILKSLADTLPGQSYQDTVRAVTGSSPSAEIIGRFAKDRPDLAQQMLQGAALMKDKGTADSQKDTRPLIADQLKTQLYPTPDQQNAVVEAALYLDTARRNARGALYDTNDTSGLSQAIEDVAGALTSRNGVQVAAPPGMRAGQFNAVLDGIKQHDIDAAGGAFDRSGNAVAPADLSRNAVLKQTAPGSSRYWVGVPNASTRDGFQPYFTGGELPQPLIFDMRQLAAAAGKNRVTDGDTAAQRLAKTAAAFAGQ